MGILAGSINGFLGSGGGIVVLCGFVFLGMEQKEAHATSILAIAPLSIISVLVYSSGGFLEWEDALPLLIGAAIGGTVGAFFLDRINKKVLEWIFTGLILISGIRMIF